MKYLVCILFNFIFGFSLLAQNENSLENQGDTNCFEHKYMLTYIDFDTSLILKWNNGNIGLIDMRSESVGKTTNLLRFYKTGELSLSATKYFVTDYEVEKGEFILTQYCVFGDIRTYYKSGKLRSFYTIPVDTIDAGNYIEYNLDEKGKPLIENEYRNYGIYNGINFGFINDSDFFLYKYKNGKLINTFSYNKEILFRLVNYDNKKYKKVNQNKYRRIIYWVNGVSVSR